MTEYEIRYTIHLKTSEKLTGEQKERLRNSLFVLIRTEEKLNGLIHSDSEIDVVGIRVTLDTNNIK